VILRDPTPEHKDDRHVFTFHDGGRPLAKIELDYVEEGKGSDVNSEITVWVGDHLEPVYGPVKLNLMADRTLGTVANRIGENTDDLGYEWKLAVEQTARATVRHLRAMGHTDEMLQRANPDSAPAPFLIRPFVSGVGTTHLYAPPGAGKSLVGLAYAYSIATGQPTFGSTPEFSGPVMYLDFEDDALTHEIRLNAICTGYGYEGTPPIVYVRLRGGLRKHLRYVRNVAKKSGVVAFVLDSVGKAKALGLDDQSATIQLFDDCDRIGPPGVALDHVTKDKNEQIKRGTVHAPSVLAIGSQFSTAATRLGWFMHEIAVSTPLTKQFNMHNSKHNHVAKQKPRTLKMHIETNETGHPTSIMFEVTDLLDFMPAHDESLPAQILKAMIRVDRPMTYDDIQQATGLGRNSVAPVVTNSKWFVKGENMGRRATYSPSREGRSVAANTPTQQ
jgi:hypothetical protein